VLFFFRKEALIQSSRQVGEWRETETHGRKTNGPNESALEIRSKKRGLSREEMGVWKEGLSSTTFRDKSPKLKAVPGTKRGAETQVHFARKERECLFSGRPTQSGCTARESLNPAKNKRTSQNRKKDAGKGGSGGRGGRASLDKFRETVLNSNHDGSEGELLGERKLLCKTGPKGVAVMNRRAR